MLLKFLTKVGAKASSQVILMSLLAVASISQSQTLNFLDNSFPESNQKYCARATALTQKSVDDFAMIIGVNSASIQLRSVHLSPVMRSICCVAIDTPKGPFFTTVGRFFGAGNIIAIDFSTRLKDNAADSFCPR